MGGGAAARGEYSSCASQWALARKGCCLVTLADVARLSATSRSTASRALNSDPRISAATTECARLAAEALGL